MGNDPPSEIMAMPTAKDERLQAYTKVGVARTHWMVRSDSWTRSAQGNTCAVLNPPELASSLIGVALEADRLDGYRFPTWSAYVAKGANATTPLAAYRERFTSTSGAVAARRKPSLCSTTAMNTIVLMDSVGMTGEPTKPSPDPRYPHSDWDFLSPIADNKARTAFLQSCREQETLFEGLVWAGELPETLAFIRSGWKSLARKMLRWGSYTQKQLTRLRRQNRKASPRKQLESMSDFLGSSWLALQFGIKPVVSDLEDAASAVLEFGRPMNAKRVKGFGKAELTATTMTQSTASNGLYFRGPQDVRRVVKVIYLGAWNNSMASLLDGPTEFGWNPKTWGLQLDRLVPSIYELIPYSWLLDYFVNVGDVIQALSTRTYNVQWVQRTEIRETLSTLKGGQYFTPYPATDEIMPGYVPPTWSFSRKYVSRAEYLGHLYPSLTLSLPGLTSQRWLNIAALVGVKFGARRRSPFERSRCAEFLYFLAS